MALVYYKTTLTPCHGFRSTLSVHAPTTCCREVGHERPACRHDSMRPLQHAALRGGVRGVRTATGNWRAGRQVASLPPERRTREISSTGASQRRSGTRSRFADRGAYGSDMQQLVGRWVGPGGRGTVSQVRTPRPFGNAWGQGTVTTGEANGVGRRGGHVHAALAKGQRTSFHRPNLPTVPCGDVCIMLYGVLYVCVLHDCGPRLC